jgi:hypothetical protein
MVNELLCGGMSSLLMMFRCIIHQKKVLKENAADSTASKEALI